MSRRTAALLVAAGFMSAALVDMLAGGGSVRVVEATPPPTPILAPASLTVVEAAAQPAVVADSHSVAAPTTEDELEEVQGDVAEPVAHGGSDRVTPRSADEAEAGVGVVRSSVSPTPADAVPPAAVATPHQLTVASDSPLTGTEVYELALAVSGSPAWARDATRISYCESRWQPAAVGAAGEEGLMQVRAIYHGAVPPDPEGQLAQAWRIYQAHGWEPWSCRP